MKKLWLTEHAYSFYGYLLRIAYWLAAIFISSLYLQYYSAAVFSKIGLMIISLLFVIGFLLFSRLLDHLFKPL